MTDIMSEDSVAAAQKILQDVDPILAINAKSRDGATHLGLGGVSMKSRDGSRYLDYLGQFYNPLAVAGSYYPGKNFIALAKVKYCVLTFLSHSYYRRFTRDPLEDGRAHANEWATLARGFVSSRRQARCQ